MTGANKQGRHQASPGLREPSQRVAKKESDYFGAYETDGLLPFSHAG